MYFGLQSDGFSFGDENAIIGKIRWLHLYFVSVALCDLEP